MVTLSTARASNATFSAPYRPVALFVGGTSGVGQGTAEAFARATKGNAHIMICGRSQASADKIIAALPTTPESKYEFIECDASLMKNVADTASTIKARVGSLNYLILSQGILTMQGFTPTAEGIDMKLALHFYSRWKFVDELMPLLEKAKSDGQEARVMTILDSTRGAPLDETDLGLKKKYSLGSAAGQGITYNNLMVEEYSKRYPQMSFTHIFPGMINTPLATRGMHWMLKPVWGVLSTAFTSLQDCGEWMVYPLLLPAYRQGAFYLDNHGEQISQKKVITSETARKTLVEHFKKETATA
ncbi:hypothetical protein FRB94_006273 [Tulasnella sp. JGI-2019a]|nr:hypothetical protein FRB93_006682 [Tulasnella sp. JGI-2019a]KAG8999288.1 hypothetical protein FRB94_006273 [Tulasnella sp. JGI-2019a]KAG9026044.1 hypothetical protein FRB95_009478 [Tulasnella sp. JGI-2019a]